MDGEFLGSPLLVNPKLETLSSSLTAQLLRHREHGFHRRDGEVFQHRREGHRHVHGAYALDRRIEIIERSVGDHRSYFARLRRSVIAFVDDDSPAGLLGRLDERVFVERHGGSRVNHFSAEADFGQFLRRCQRNLDHAAGRDNRDVVAGAFDVGHPERHRILLLRHRPFERYIILSSKKTTGLSSRMAVFSNPLAS